MQHHLRPISVLLALTILLSCLSGCLFAQPSSTTETTAQPTTEATFQPTTVETEPTVMETEPVQVVPGEFELPEFSLEFQLTDLLLKEADAMIDYCEEISYSDASREDVEAAWEDLDLRLSYIGDQVSIAQILYYLDLTDETLSETYLDSYDQYLALADRANMLQKRMYDDSPVKDWFFEDWTDLEIQFLLSYTSEIIELQARLNEIEVEFLDLSENALYDGFVPLYIEYVSVGNQMARLSGYDNFYDYKSALTYGRDYGEEELALFRGYVKTELMPSYEDFVTPIYTSMNALTDEEYMTVAYYMNMDYDQQPTNYLMNYIDSTTGSTNEWFNDLFTSGNYIRSNDQNSYTGAFCVGFESYDMAYCYFGPGYQSTSSVVHEMGHYYANHFPTDYACFDLLETHSQSNEALLMTHMRDSLTENEYDFIKYYDLYDKVLTLIICTMVDDFEQRIYNLDSMEGFTSEDIDRIAAEVCDEYFSAYGGMEYVSSYVVDFPNYLRNVTINSPCYYISYATSVVTTLNIFALAEEDPEAAREVYRKLVEEAGEIQGYENALLYAGAASPFQQESFETIRKLYQ